MPGTNLMTVVRLDRVYIDANYRGTDLIRGRVGPRVSIHVDACDIWLDGVVNSLQAYGAVPPITPSRSSPCARSNAPRSVFKVGVAHLAAVALGIAVFANACPGVRRW